jgi:hypothetical protein
MPKVVLSTNQNLEYLFYMPITSFVWNHFGFDVLNMVVGESEVGVFVNAYTNEKTSSNIINIPNIPLYRSDTISQFSRLYGSCCVDNTDEYVITGDIDLIPLSSYLYRDFDKINAYNYDLTDFTQFPMCHVGMSVSKWREFLNLKHGDILNQIENGLDYMSHKSKSIKWEDYWDTDQAFLTEKIKAFGVEKFKVINRGREPNGYAYRRVDRGYWHWQKDVEYIDSHLLKNPYSYENFNKTFELIQHTLQGVDCNWMKDYHKEFTKLIVNN